jgi:hypothetical protein
MACIHPLALIHMIGRDSIFPSEPHSTLVRFLYPTRTRFPRRRSIFLISCSPVVLASLHQADRIKAFAKAQRSSITDVTTTIPGGEAGQTVSPCDSAGCYAPGGRYTSWPHTSQSRDEFHFSAPAQHEASPCRPLARHADCLTMCCIARRCCYDQS